MDALLSHAREMRTLFLHLTDEWNVRLTEADDISSAASQFVSDWAPAIKDRLDGLFAAMSLEVDALPPEELRRAEPVVRAFLQPYFLLSPFCRRVVDWPLGYPGDYRAVEMLFSGKEVGSSPVGTLLGNYTLGVAPCAAHRGRAPWTHTQVDAWIARNGVPRPRILSFACGPEVVLREWVRRGGTADLTLADHDPHALAFASRLLRKVIVAKGSPTSLREVRVDARDVMKGGALAHLGTDTPFDIVTVLGLLDYLDDAMCVTFLRSLADTIRPGGLLLLSNVSGPNPARALVETVGGWRILHRTPEAFAALVGAVERFTELDVTVHVSGTNVYVAATRV